MHTWTDSDVGAIIDLVARSISPHDGTNDALQQVLNELNQMLRADSWRYEAGSLSLSGPSSGWNGSRTSNRLEASSNMERAPSVLRCTVKLACRYAGQRPMARPDLAVPRSDIAPRSSSELECRAITTLCSCQSANSCHPVVACLWTSTLGPGAQGSGTKGSGAQGSGTQHSGTQGQSHCLEYSRGLGQPAFSERDQAMLRVIASQLDLLSAGRNITSQRVQTPSDLSRRQREVLELLLVGKNCKQIASELGLSVHTVNDYIKAIYRRYDVSCRAELLAAAHVGA